ncbi:MAG: hypothetical protein QM811_16035 [Pirellulales bacterium]
MSTRLTIGMLVGLILYAASLPAEDAPASKAAPTLPPAVVTKTAEAQADAKTPGGKFLRVMRNDKGVVVGMETSIARYMPNSAEKKETVVDLISAVHIGEKAYYESARQGVRKIRRGAV